MSDEKQNSSLDLLGIKPIGDAANTTVEKSFQGVEGFLKSVCVPALDELGLLLKDKVRHWRLNNILRILDKAKGKLRYENEELKIQAHPRVALAIIDNGSLNDNDEVQEMWAGLFASSCNKDEQDDENLIFVDLLKQLTLIEARILKYSCERVRKVLYSNGLIVADELKVNCDELVKLTLTKDIHRLDRELDHMRSLDLIGSSLGGGFDENLTANIRPTALALHLYVRCQGYNTDPAFFWQDNVITKAELDKEEKERAEAKQKAKAAERQTTIANNKLDPPTQN